MGISWFELAINFIAVAQQWIPTPLGIGQHARFRIVSHQFPTKKANVGLNTMAEALRSVDKFWQAVSGVSLLRKHWISDVRSLRFFGCLGYVRGFRIRPRMLQQQPTMTVVSDYLQATQHRMKFDDLPTVPLQDPLINFSVPQDVENVNEDLEKRDNMYRRLTRQRRQQLA